MKKRIAFACSLAAAAAFTPACGSSNDSLFGNPDPLDGSVAGDAQAPSFGEGGPNGGDASGPCVGLECQRVACTGGAKTTVSGTVYDPAGKIPLYNAVVYVPNAPLAPLPEGASCDQCGATLSGKPIVTALTDTKGRFVLENVPVGKDIPLVIQIGKWRRQITVPSVAACVETKLTDASQTRLPRNKAEGNLPKIALATGGADALECLLRKIGIDDAEFTPETGNGRVNLYAGQDGTDHYAASLNQGAAITPAQNFWKTEPTLAKYDMVLLSCEGQGHNPANKGPEALKAMEAYANTGGRVFASHWHHQWLEDAPAPSLLPTVAKWHHQDDLADPFTADIDQSFPKGKALAEWLVDVGSSAPLGKLTIHAGQHTVDGVNGATQNWIGSTTPKSSQYFSLNTPVGAAPEAQCGRIVNSDIHVSSGDASGPKKPFPTGCTTTTLSDQEKVLEFMLFDLSSCIQKDDKPPAPPPPEPR